LTDYSFSSGKNYNVFVAFRCLVHLDLIFTKLSHPLGRNTLLVFQPNLEKTYGSNEVGIKIHVFAFFSVQLCKNFKVHELSLASIRAVLL